LSGTIPSILDAVSEFFSLPFSLLFCNKKKKNNRKKDKKKMEEKPEVSSLLCLEGSDMATHSLAHFARFFFSLLPFFGGFSGMEGTGHEADDDRGRKAKKS
jgi:hypothetical protein